MINEKNKQIKFKNVKHNTQYFTKNILRINYTTQLTGHYSRLLEQNKNLYLENRLLNKVLALMLECDSVKEICRNVGVHSRLLCDNANEYELCRQCLYNSLFTKAKEELANL